LYCKQVGDDRATLVQQAARIQQLESELSAADARNREFVERVASLANELQQAREALESLQQEKSVWRQLRCKLTRKK
jgi:hypothetical protein